jgi:hypothetical protein
MDEEVPVVGEPGGVEETSEAAEPVADEEKITHIARDDASEEDTL